MKKLFAVFLALTFILTFSGCAPQDYTSAVQPEKPQAEAFAADSILEIMKNGTFYMLYTAVIATEEGEVESEIAFASDGKSVATTAEVMGLKLRTLLKDGIYYSINDAQKTYQKLDIPADNTTEALTDADSLVFSENGTADINGKSLAYEEYKGTDDSYSIRFYFDGSTLYAIEVISTDGNMLMIIKEFSDKIPDNMLELPADYTESALPDYSAGIELDEETKRELEEIQEQYGDLDMSAIEEILNQPMTGEL